ncbi:MAG: TlpA disulfide reductase family protein [Alcanivorax sp.]|jgi:thiol-disulfide isomerase/thioredoxin|tara:strand:- start:5761 stop:6285 length:525 start_codon:yes stop_codon:yes gene_type:complete
MKKLVVLLSILLGMTANAANNTEHSEHKGTTKAPAFALPLLANGQTSSLTEKVTLASYHGKVIYLDFWASWCTPCRKSLPALNLLRNELADQGFEVLAINLDESPEEGLEFLEEIPVDYPTLFDDSGTAAAYQLRGMPTAYLIDRDGNLQAQHVGFNPKELPSIRAAIVDLLEH